MRAKITKSTVDGAQPAANTLKIYDTEVRGFLLVVTPAGSKSYAIEYRAGTGRAAPMRRMVIGKHGVLTPAEARKLAREKLAQVTGGRDPAQERKISREVQTFGDLIDLYFAKGARKRNGTSKKPSTIASDRGRAEQHLRPLLGKTPADKLTSVHVVRMRDIVAGDRSTSRSTRGRGSVVKGGHGTAAQCVALVGSIYSWAIRDGQLLRGTENPARGVDKAPVKKRERYLSGAEIARLAEALDGEVAATNNPHPSAAIKLLLFTGCRKGEIAGLRWKDIDFERMCLRLPDSKTGAKLVHLNPPALALLQVLPRLETNPYVIPGVRSGAPARPAIDKVWGRVRNAAGLADVRLHDLRHTYASVAVSGKASLPIIGALLGHKHTSTTARYAHLSDDPLRAVNDMVGERIAAAMAGAGEVVPMRRPK